MAGEGPPSTPCGGVRAKAWMPACVGMTGWAGLAGLVTASARRSAVYVFLVFLLALPALAVEPGERLTDPALEARARTISTELRCLVCQNESIDESHADLAHDIRILVRERLTAGDSDAQAVQAVVGRYGAFVLLRPPVEPATYMLWFAPPALILIGLAATVLWMRRRVPIAASAPLSAEEQRRLDGLLGEHDG
jgi:cytochrome c-type biogenesis protein CcmH